MFVPIYFEIMGDRELVYENTGVITKGIHHWVNGDKMDTTLLLLKIFGQIRKKNQYTHYDKHIYSICTLRSDVRYDNVWGKIN